MHSTLVVVLCIGALVSYSWAETVIFEEGVAGTANSRLLLRTIVKERFRIGQIVTRDFTFTGPTGSSITYIKITDLKNIEGASATKTVGGVGTAAVTFTFTSKRGLGMKNRIEVFGTTA